ncbi:MAG: NAD(P)-dependent oxidoreductase [Planctomycetales bacterium]|nr:NAD(P)-dependent oxidoreductase [Planctomycetales bacterium]
MTNEPVGLVGLGLLGAAIAERLISAGYELSGYDLATDRMAHFKSLGGRPASGVGETARICRRTILCLPDSDSVEEVAAQLLPQLKPGDVVIDMTTGDFERTRTLARSYAKLDVDWIDASVLGSSTCMRQGEATLLVGGDKRQLEKHAELLHCLGRSMHHAGPVGSGQALKLAANLVLGLNRTALAEGLVFAERCGVDLEVTLEAFCDGVAYSRCMDDKGPKMLKGDFVPVARLRQHLKDVRLLLKSASAGNFSLPMTRAHSEVLEQAMQMDLGEQDNSAVIEAIRGYRSRGV